MAAIIKGKKCGNCAYSSEFAGAAPDHPLIVCKRYPPTVMGIMGKPPKPDAMPPEVYDSLPEQLMLHCYWPQVAREEICGEFKPTILGVTGSSKANGV